MLRTFAPRTLDKGLQPLEAHTKATRQGVKTPTVIASKFCFNFPPSNSPHNMEGEHTAPHVSPSPTFWGGVWGGENGQSIL